MSSTFSMCSLTTLACNILYTWPLVLLGVHFVEVNTLYRLFALYVAQFVCSSLVELYNIDLSELYYERLDKRNGCKIDGIFHWIIPFLGLRFTAETEQVFLHRIGATNWCKFLSRLLVG